MKQTLKEILAVFVIHTKLSSFISFFHQKGTGFVAATTINEITIVNRRHQVKLIYYTQNHLIVTIDQVCKAQADRLLKI